jgi:aquaporin related protein
VFQAVFWTGGSLNPARSFGPAIVVHKFTGYHWLYWVAPLVGAALAAALHKLIKSLEYESANPDPEEFRPVTSGTYASHATTAVEGPTRTYESTTKAVEDRNECGYR